MLAFKTPPHGSKRNQVNILPCKIDRNGPAKVTKRFWSPATEEDGSKTAYFRGRRLRGRVIKLPKSYHGVTVKRSDQVMYEDPQEPQASSTRQVEDDEDAAEAEPQREPIKILAGEGKFDEIIVWGHDRIPAMDDSFAKGIGEWITFAEAIHSTGMKVSQSSESSCP